MDACILVTHQPPSWLAEANRAKVFNPDIAKAGRFAVHLCGHEHLGKTHTESRDGSPARRIGLGRSLLALEPTEDGFDRLMGYQSLRMTIYRKEGTGSIRYWPRKAEIRGSGNFSFGPDGSFELSDDEGTEELPESFFRCPNYSVHRNEGVALVSLEKDIAKSHIDAEFEKSFFVNGWPERSQLLLGAISSAQRFADSLRWDLDSDDHSLKKPGDDIQISNEVALGLKYDQKFFEYVHRYNRAAEDLRRKISEYNRLLYPLTDQFFIDSQTRGLDKFLDKEWNETKQKESDDYYRKRDVFLREICMKYEIPLEATVGDLRASEKYLSEITLRRKELSRLVDNLMDAKQQIDAKRKYYDLALANQVRK